MISVSTGIRSLLRVSQSAILVALLLPSTVSTVVSEEITLDDIMALLEADVGEKVIIKQIRSAENRLVPTVEAIIQLKVAGASDDLLAALIEPPESIPEKSADPAGRSGPDPSDPQFRVYTELDDSGDPVLHITNLDASGRRIGGEVEEPVHPNVMRPSQRRPEPEYYEDDYDYEAPPPGGDQGSDVVVNVYPPEPSTQVVQEHADPYYQGQFYGFVPSYVGYGNRLYGGYPYYKYGIGYYRYNHYPPGSYTHFLRYHHSGDGPRLRRYNSYPARTFGIVPYTYGNAAARNRRYFKRH